MTARLPAPPAPGPLEEYSRAFDAHFRTRAQRRSFREYLVGLLLPRDRNKTLTALAGAEPITEAQQAPVQRLQGFLSEAPWELPLVTQQRLEGLLADPDTRPHEAGVLIIDETGDRKDGTKTDHVARQYLGSLGKVDHGIVAVTSLWADERVYYPLHVEPYTPASRLPQGKKDPAFRTKPQLGMQLVDAAVALGVSFRAVVADCLYGEHAAFEGALWAAGLPYVVALKPSQSTWVPEDPRHTPKEVAQEVRWAGPEAPGDWTPVERQFRDGHTEIWWAAELTWAGYGPEQTVRLIVATTDPATLPEKSTWFLATNLPAPGSPRAEEWPVPPADLAEVVRLYGLRTWVEQSYKQVKQELGWADFQVRADRAIRRHWELVCCAFAFCWWEWFRGQREAVASREPLSQVDPRSEARGEEKKRRSRPSLGAPAGGSGSALLAAGGAAGARLAGPVDAALALVAGLERGAPAARLAGITGSCRKRPAAQSGSPSLIPQTTDT
jgi:SRSO17 transposase